ncbi:MAG: hypothetical protein JJE37_10645 [Methyloceanibacter sp.]|nr:hypothetical protein [Methyloceanibacter sp.]
MSAVQSPDVLYAVAVRDSADLFLTHIIRRSASGVYVIFRRDNPRWDPHISHHKSRQYHHKSFHHKAFEHRRQKLDERFRGTENLVTFSIAPDEHRAINVPYEVTSFQGVLEIEVGELRPGTFVSVDLTEPNGKPILTLRAEVIRQAVINDDVPWILVTLFRSSH